MDLKILALIVTVYSHIILQSYEIILIFYIIINITKIWKFPIWDRLPIFIPRRSFFLMRQKYTLTIIIPKVIKTTVIFLRSYYIFVDYSIIV